MNVISVNRNAYERIGKEIYPLSLWSALFYVWNKRSRRNWFGLSEAELLSATGMGRKKFYESKRRLVEAGLVFVKAGKKGRFPEYHIVTDSDIVSEDSVPHG